MKLPYKEEIIEKIKEEVGKSITQIEMVKGGDVVYIVHFGFSFNNKMFYLAGTVIFTLTSYVPETRLVPEDYTISDNGVFEGIIFIHTENKEIYYNEHEEIEI